MKFGICVTPWWYHGWASPIPDVNAYKKLHNIIGITDVRLSINLAQVFPDVNIENWKLLDPFINPMYDAGLKLYFNPGGCPPFASQGQPAYIGSVAAWPPETPVPPAIYGGSGWWDTPDHPDPNKIHFFGDPAFTAVDSKMPTRPYLNNPPHIDPKFMQQFAGYKLTMQYRRRIDSCGVGNEPGGNGDPVMRQDTIAYGGKLGDTITDRYWPEIVVPYSDGVLSADPNMILVGPEADGDGVLDRLCTLEESGYNRRPSVSRYDILSIHPYGDLIGGDYRTTVAFKKILDKWQSDRPLRIGEISGDKQAVYDWSVATIANNPKLEGIFYLNDTMDMFFEPGSWPKEPIMSAIGKKFKDLFASVNIIGD